MQIVRVLGKLEPGGAQLAALRLSRELATRYDVTARLLVGDATPDGVDLARRYGIDVEAFHVADRVHPTRNLQWQRSLPFARWLGARFAGADVVHAHMVGAWWAAGQVVDARTPFVASEHNQVDWSERRIRALRTSAARVDRFHAMGPSASRFARRAGLRPGVLRAARSAVDGLDHDVVDPGLRTPRLTFTGRFCSDKGIDVLVEALAWLPDSVRPAVHLLGDGPLRGDVVTRLARLPWGDTVSLPGWVDRPWTVVAGSTVHVVPSREEAWSQSAVLAMGLGVPVVGTRVDGLVDTLADARGILVPPDDPQALARALAEVLTSGTTSDLPGARVYAHRFTPARVAEYHHRDYEGLITAAQPRPGGRDVGAVAPTATILSR